MTNRQACVSFFALFTLTALTAGCGSFPLPTDRLASSEAAIRTAIEVGAPNEPRAALHLKLAKDQLDQGKALIKDGDNQRADYVLRRAEADAELSLALARENNSKTEAQQVLDQLKAAQGK